MTDLTKHKHQSVSALLSDLRNRSGGKTERQTLQSTLQLANGAEPLSIICSVSLATAVPITAHNKSHFLWIHKAGPYTIKAQM